MIVSVSYSLWYLFATAVPEVPLFCCMILVNNPVNTFFECHELKVIFRLMIKDTAVNVDDVFAVDYIIFINFYCFFVIFFSAGVKFQCCELDI